MLDCLDKKHKLLDEHGPPDRVLSFWLANCPIRRQEQVCPETSFLILGLVQILLTSFSRPFESLQYMARKVVEASAGKMIAPF